MGLHRALKRQLRQTINVAQLVSRDDRGAATYGAATPVKARVELKTNTTRGLDGVQRSTTHMIITESEIRATDAIWLPGDSAADASKLRRPSEVRPFPDENGNVTHYETFV